VSEPAPGSGQDIVIDLERRELLAILRSVQEADSPVPISDREGGQEITWHD
jgi:hypothetical protein